MTIVAILGVLLLALFGFVEFLVRVALLLVLVASIIGMVVFMWADNNNLSPLDFIQPHLWTMADRLLAIGVKV